MKEKKTMYTSVLLALLTASAYFLADTVDVLIGKSLAASVKFAQPNESDSSAPRPGRDLTYTSILDRGLFGDGTKPSSSPVPVQSTMYKLIGTVEGEVFAGAVLADSAGQVFYQINRKLPDGSAIIKVERHKISLRRADGEIIEIEVADDTKIVPVQKSLSAGVKKLAGNNFLVDQREVLASTENMGQMLTQAQTVPYMEKGKIAGFRITRIVPGSIYAKIGLQNGDVIQQINSQPLDDPGKFFQLYQGLRSEKSISIDLLRNGSRQTMNYDIR
jgi:general secretion pathway protein C